MEDDEEFNDDEDHGNPQYVYDEDGNEIDLNEYQSTKMNLDRCKKVNG